MKQDSVIKAVAKFVVYLKGRSEGLLLPRKTAKQPT